MIRSLLRAITLFLVLLMASASVSSAQTNPAELPNPQLVEVSAEDGATLAGSFFSLADMQRPALLLLHAPGASREIWTPLFEPLWSAGHNILAVDLRGHGESSAEQNWETAMGDVLLWLDWLQSQETVQTRGVSAIGVDLGGILAVIGCETHESCLGAIAVSPVGLGCDSRDCAEELEGIAAAGIQYLDQSAVHGLTDADRRSAALVMTSTGDDISLASLRRIGAARSPRVEVQVISEGGHAIELLTASRGSALEALLRWLDGHTPPNLTHDEIEEMVAAGDPANGEVLFNEGSPNFSWEQHGRCSGCHYADSEDRFHAPGLLNIAERAASRVEGESAAVYLYNSIVAPDSYVIEDYFPGVMPWQYDKVFSYEEIADLVAYLLTLN